jgi:PAS domain S-box-containing protein
MKTMTQKDKTKEEFVEEVRLLQKRIAELEATDTDSKQQQWEKTMNTFGNFPEWLLEKWQAIADLLAEFIGIPAALIMKTENEFMEVFISSQSENNPYQVGEKAKWYGLYCETVIKTQNKLLVPNAIKDKKWDKNPDIKLGMIAYLGFPLNFPDNQPFGTLCVLDNKERPFTLLDEKLIQQFKNVIELDLALIQSFELKTSQLATTIVQEVTERKKAEQTIKTSQERLLFATEGANVGIWNWNIITGKLIFSNRCKSLFGIPLNDTMSYARFLDALHPDDRESTDKAVNDAISNHKEYDIEYRSLWPDGSIHWLAAKGRGYYDATGKAIRMEGIALDITEHRKMQEELRKWSEELEKKVEQRTKELTAAREAALNIFNSSRDAVMLLTPEKGFFKGNPAAIEIFGCRDESEFTTMSPADLSPEYQPDGKLSTVEAQKMMAIAMEKGSHFLEWTHKRVNGQEFFADVLLTRMKWEDRMVLQATVRDITERKKLEDELKEKIHNLEVFHKVAVGRELKMIELKEKIAELEAQLVKN